jgi:hypothetical protein
LEVGSARGRSSCCPAATPVGAQPSPPTLYDRLQRVEQALAVDLTVGAYELHMGRVSTDHDLVVLTTRSLGKIEHA